MTYTYDRTARINADQYMALAEVVAKTAGRVVQKESQDLAKRVISEVLRKDKDGSLLGTVYHDYFEREALVKMIEKQLLDGKVLIQVADLLVDELEKRK